MSNGRRHHPPAGVTRLSHPVGIGLRFRIRAFEGATRETDPDGASEEDAQVKAQDLGV